jgi:hypothetical protein
MVESVATAYTVSKVDAVRLLIVAAYPELAPDPLTGEVSQDQLNTFHAYRRKQALAEAKQERDSYDQSELWEEVAEKASGYN